MRFAAVVLLHCLLLAAASPAYAILPDEFDVYTDDMAKPGETEVELHINTTPSGIDTPSYSGEVVANHGWRLTPEISYGINNDWEVGMYIPTAWSAGTSYAPGLRGKLKWVPVKAADNPQDFFLGVNLEASAIAKRFEPNNGFEVMLISGIRGANWLFAFDPKITWSLNQMRQAPTGSLNMKLMRKASDTWSAGAEYYSLFGDFSSTLPFNRQSNLLFAVVNYSGKPFDFNFGVGRGVTSASDKWTIKTVIELPL